MQGLKSATTGQFDRSRVFVSSKSKDTLFASPLSTISGFKFDQSVVDVFPDMISRSVPGYEAIVKMIGEIAGRYAQDNSHCYDLGCSLGASTLSMHGAFKTKQVKIIAVDNSPAMIERCKKIIPPSPSLDFRCADINECEIENASVVVLNFTLQFIPLGQRKDLIQKIYSGLRPKGILILSEKICFADKEHQLLMTELHHNFKKANGYSDLEIAQKRSAIENVLIPESIADHLDRFKTTGFASADVWFQCLNFCSLIAIKS